MCCVLQAIQEQMKLHGQEPVSFQDVKVGAHTEMDIYVLCTCV